MTKADLVLELVGGFLGGQPSPEQCRKWTPTAWKSCQDGVALMRLLAYVDLEAAVRAGLAIAKDASRFAGVEPQSSEALGQAAGWLEGARDEDAARRAFADLMGRCANGGPSAPEKAMASAASALILAYSTGQGAQGAAEAVAHEAAAARASAVLQARGGTVSDLGLELQKNLAVVAGIVRGAVPCPTPRRIAEAAERSGRGTRG